jgi:hypothetical protein
MIDSGVRNDVTPDVVPLRGKEILSAYWVAVAR